MSSKFYAFVGNWFFRPCEMGLTVFRYLPESGALELVETHFPDVGAGALNYDLKRDVLHVVNEIENLRGCIGGGGYVMDVRLDPKTETLTVMNEVRSLGCYPSFLCLSDDGEYALVTHMGAGGHVTEPVKEAGGTYTTRVHIDNGSLVLFEVNADGTIGKACDIDVVQGDGVPGGHVCSKVHSVNCDSTGSVFFVCDKGSNAVYTYRVDRDRKKLVCLDTLRLEEGTVPRYSEFHERLPIVYVTNEGTPEVHTYGVDLDTGKITQTARTRLLDADTDVTDLSGVETSDIVLARKHNCLYASVRGTETVAVLPLNGDGLPRLEQVVAVGGVNPRGLCVSPDERFLFAMNMESGNITRFAIGDDGRLEAAVEVGHAPKPGNMTIVEYT